MVQDRDTAWESPDPPAGDQPLFVDLEGFEGPLDLLLTLARTQKVDLGKISILDLADQYLGFVTEARRLNLEVAADYLVMAAWLAYLKSRLLLPPDDDEEEPSAEELALRLQVRLQRLEAMREAGARLMSRDRLGRDVFARGRPEGLTTHTHPSYVLSLFELLRGYARVDRRNSARHISIARRPVYTLEEAIERLSGLIGQSLSWTQLKDFLPERHRDGPIRRSAVASLFAASLELAKQGRVSLHQRETFAPLYLKSTGAPDDP